MLILGKPDFLYSQDDYPINIPDFFDYRIIMRCTLKLKSTMTAIFRRMKNLPLVREGLIKNARTPDGPWLSKHFIDVISLVESVDELFDVLMHNQYLSWINFWAVEVIVEHTKSELAQKVMDSFRKYTLQLDIHTVFSINTTVPGIDKPGLEYTKVREVFSVDINRLTVGKLLQHKTFLEQNVFDINVGSTRVGSIDNHAWAVVWIIPAECSYHVYRHANTTLHKFDIIASLEIEDYPVIKKSAKFSIDPLLGKFV